MAYNIANNSGYTLAQTFKTPNTDKAPNGLFIVGIGVYFSNMPDVNDTISTAKISIRELTDAGVPSTISLYENIIDKNSIVFADDLTKTTNGKATKETFIQFNYPIYLKPNSNYAIVFGSNNDGYDVYYSEIGKEDVTTGELIEFQKQQLESGTMMASSDGYTWTAIQENDLKFTLYRAKFDITRERVIYITDINTKLNTFGIMNLKLPIIVYDNTDYNIYYTINANDIDSESTSWTAMQSEEAVFFNYSEDWVKNGMKLSIKVVLKTNDEYLSPIVNLENFSLYLGQYQSNGTYIQSPFVATY